MHNDIERNLRELEEGNLSIRDEQSRLNFIERNELKLGQAEWTRFLKACENYRKRIIAISPAMGS